MSMDIVVVNIALWLAGPFAVASLLMVFFTTKFPQHLFELARAKGWFNRLREEWEFHDPELDYRETVGNLTRRDFETWMSTGWFGTDHPKLAELLTCTGCFAMQCGFWLGLLVAACTGQWWFWPLAFLTWPSAGRVVFKKI